MRIFVSGATGVIGTRVLPILVANGHQVSASGRTPEKRTALQKLGVTALDVDLFNPEQARRALQGQEAVINLATHVPPAAKMLMPGAWRENDRVRQGISSVLTRIAIEEGVQTYIQESFAPVYEDAGDNWIDETAPLKPASYNRSMLDAEAVTQNFAAAGRTGVILRFAFFYGPDAEQNSVMLGTLHKGWAPMPGRADAFMSSVSHDDAASAVVAALKAKSGAYNIVDNEPLRRGDLLNFLAGYLGIKQPKFPPVWTSYLMGSVGRLIARSQRISNQKFRAETSWKPIYPSAKEGWQDILGSKAKAA